MLSCLFFIWRYFNSCCERSPRHYNCVFLILLQHEGQRLDGGSWSQSLKREREAELNTLFYQSVFGSTTWLNTSSFLYVLCCFSFIRPDEFVTFRAFQRARRASSPGGLGGAPDCLLVRFVYYYWIKIHPDRCLTFECISTSPWRHCPCEHE